MKKKIRYYLLLIAAVARSPATATAPNITRQREAGTGSWSAGESGELSGDGSL